MAVVMVLLLIVVGTVLFHFLSPWQETPLASNWGSIDTTIDITFAITGAVFVLVIVFTAWCVYRFRYQPDRRSEYEPENKKLEYWLMGLTAVGVAAMLAPGLAVYAKFVDAPEDSQEVDVLGSQWQWAFRLPGADGELGVADVHFMSFDNPLGVDPNDPAGQDDVLVNGNELHLEVDQPVKILLRSKDVLHDFYVPEMRAKMDSVPGQVSYMWFTPTKPGRYDVLCAELCGVGHFNMRASVVVDDAAAYEDWLAGQPTFAGLQEPVAEMETSVSPAERGRTLAQTQGCVACHSLDGSRLVGPSWQGIFGRSTTLADGSTVVADEEYLKESILEPGAAVVQGFPPVMPALPLGEEDVEALIAFLKEQSSEAQSH